MQLGQFGENVAAAYLQKQGMVVEDRNFRCRFGEIDIVARDGKTLAFVEVRTRQGNEFGTPEESVTVRKKERVVKAAMAYLDSRGKRSSNWRLDLLAIELDGMGRVCRIELVKNLTD